MYYIFSLREDVSFYRDFFFFMEIEDVISKEATYKKGSFLSIQPSYALSALIGRVQTYFFFGNLLIFSKATRAHYKQ